MSFVKLFFWGWVFLFSLPQLSQASGKGIACVGRATKAYAKLTPLQLTGKRVGKSLQVQDFEGKVSLVPRKNLKLGQKCLLVRVQKSRLRDGPGSSFKPAEVSKKGDVYLDLGGEDGWTQVQSAEGEKAWINLDHTWSPFSNQMRMSFEDEP